MAMQHAGKRAKGKRRGRAVATARSNPAFQLPPMVSQATIAHAAVANAKSESVTIPRVAETKDGQIWAERALHPCSNTIGGASPIPDDSTALSATYETRDLLTLSRPSSITTDTWDFQIVTTSCPDLPILWRTRAAGAAFGAWTRVFEGPPSQAPGVFTLGGVNTATALVEPDISIVPQLARELVQYRATHLGITGVLVANSLTDQGTVTAGQFGNKPDLSTIQPITAAYSTAGGTNKQQIAFCVYTDVPKSSEELIRLVPTAYNDEARAGFYLPVRYDDPIHAWTPQSSTEWNNAASNNRSKAGMPIALSDAGASFDMLTDPIVSSDVDGVRRVFTTAGPVNLQMGVVFMEGLDKAASIQIKLQAGLEVVAGTNSIAQSFMTEAPPADETAIKMVHELSRRMPVAYPHRYNSLGMLVPLIGKLAMTVLPAVAPWLAGKISGWMRGSPGSGVRSRPMEIPLD